MKKEKVLITGGNGYIGYNLYLYLKKNNFDVVLIDNLSSGAKKRKNIEKLYSFSCLDKKKLNTLIIKENIKHIFHLAGHISVRDTDRKKNYENNFLITKVLVDVANKNEVKSIIFSSTSAVYSSKEEKIKENSQLSPTSEYGKNKLRSENLIREKFKKHFAILRLFNVAGATKDGGGPTNKFANSIIKILVKTKINNEVLNINIKKNKNKIIYPIRDFIYVNDVVKIFYKSFQLINLNKKSITVNVGRSIPVNLLDLISFFEKKFKHKFKIKFNVLSKKEIFHSVSCNKTINKILNYNTKYVSLNKILKSSYAWFNEK